MKYKSSSDKELLEYLKADEHEAFGENYDRYWKRLLAIAYIFSKDKSDAQDIVQEIFTQLWVRCAELSTQRWVLGFLDQIENFANWRHTGYPVLIPTNYPGNITGGRIPRRYIVPESEETLHRENFLAAKARQSGDNTLLSRVWWDKE